MIRTPESVNHGALTRAATSAVEIIIKGSTCFAGTLTFLNEKVGIELTTSAETLIS